VVAHIRARWPATRIMLRADSGFAREDLKKLADAWQPLYPTLSQEQKRRMAALPFLCSSRFQARGHLRQLVVRRWSFGWSTRVFVCGDVWVPGHPPVTEAEEFSIGYLELCPVATITHGLLK